jgi:preprotein translocase subunit YajC
MDPGSLLMLVIVMIIFYFVLVRPQKKRAAEHSALLGKLGPGDEVVTVGGLYGFINRIEDDMVYLEVSEGVEIRFSKQSISRRIEGGVAEPEADVVDGVEELETAIEAPEPDGTLPPSP